MRRPKAADMRSHHHGFLIVSTTNIPFNFRNLVTWNHPEKLFWEGSLAGRSTKKKSFIITDWIYVYFLLLYDLVLIRCLKVTLVWFCPVADCKLLFSCIFVVWAVFAANWLTTSHRSLDHLHTYLHGCKSVPVFQARPQEGDDLVLCLWPLKSTTPHQFNHSKQNHRCWQQREILN